MVKHVILWKLKEDLGGKSKEEVVKDIKKGLESLAGKVPGLLSVNVVINPMESSNADVMLDSELDSQEALKVYQTHPEHVNVADTYVRPYTEVRMCMDYEI